MSPGLFIKTGIINFKKYTFAEIRCTYIKNAVQPADTKRGEKHEITKSSRVYEKFNRRSYNVYCIVPG